MVQCPVPLPLHIFQLFLSHTEIVTEFVDDGQADLFADFRIAGANRLNILLVEDDMIGSARQVEYAFLRGGHAMKDAEKQPPLLSGLR
jgi:hypothetical protein